MGDIRPRIQIANCKRQGYFLYERFNRGEKQNQVATLVSLAAQLPSLTDRVNNNLKDCLFA